MNRLFYLCSMAFLALYVAGCGKDSTAAETKAPSSAAVEGADIDSLMRQLVDAVAQKDAAKPKGPAAKSQKGGVRSANADARASKAGAKQKNASSQARKRAKGGHRG